MTKITTKEFVHVFCDIWQSDDRRLCFVLGAGASRTSGIKTGNELATRWLNEIKDRMSDQGQQYDTFIEHNHIQVNWPGQSYPEIYKERFKLDVTSGFDYINKEMESATPGYGYSVLAQILAAKQHNIIITTNFDNLTEEALYTYTSKRPLICGHESLAAFAKPSVKRPLIVKIHRDRYLAPKSQPEEVDKIDDEWADALGNVFNNCIPVFIGYGGNDGSLMGYLEKIGRFDNLFWCERKGANVPARVQAFLNKNDGKLIEIEGFDEMMFMLQDSLKLPLLDDEIKNIAAERARKYQDTVVKIRSNQAASIDPEVQDAARRLVEKAGDDWWAWELRAQSAKGNDVKIQIYREALVQIPDSGELHNNYALFLNNNTTRYEEVEEHYLKAMKFAPYSLDVNVNYALFLIVRRRDYDKAEQLFRDALSINPKDPHVNSNYAVFLQDVRSNTKRADIHYETAVLNDPYDITTLVNYSTFLHYVLSNFDKAEMFYRQAIRLDPENVTVMNNYGFFLLDIRKDFDQAEKFFARALQIDNLHLKANLNYAIMLTDVRRDIEKASRIYSKLVKAFPRDAELQNNFALFLKNHLKNFGEAERHFKLVVKLQPENANGFANYAGFLFCVGRNKEALKYLRLAEKYCSQDVVQAELYFYNYAHLNDSESLNKLVALLCIGVRSKGFSLQDNIDVAIKDGHSNSEMLQRVGDILTKDVPLADLCENRSK